MEWGKGNRKGDSAVGSKMPRPIWVPQKLWFHLVLPVYHKVALRDHALPTCTSFLSYEIEVFTLSA